MSEVKYRYQTKSDINKGGEQMLEMMHKLVDFEGKLFKNIDMKGFPIEQRDKAIEFLKKA